MRSIALRDIFAALNIGASNVTDAATVCARPVAGGRRQPGTKVWCYPILAHDKKHYFILPKVRAFFSILKACLGSTLGSLPGSVRWLPAEWMPMAVVVCRCDWPCASLMGRGERRHGGQNLNLGRKIGKKNRLGRRRACGLWRWPAPEVNNNRVLLSTSTLDSSPCSSVSRDQTRAMASNNETLDFTNESECDSSPPPSPTNPHPTYDAAGPGYGFGDTGYGRGLIGQDVGSQGDGQGHLAPPHAFLDDQDLTSFSSSATDPVPPPPSRRRTTDLQPDYYL